jgi:hypothetical protein
MFDFPFDRNDRNGFVWMSPAVLVARAVQIAVFEVSVVHRTLHGGEPRAELGRELIAGFGRCRNAGLAVGAPTDSRSLPI